ncbi:hypothetical protein [Bradyrhizobium sp. USDA 4518]
MAYDKLLTPDAGHACGASILRHFSQFAFGNEATKCWSRCEYKLRYPHPQTGIEQWPDLLVAIPSRENAELVAIMDDFALPSRRAGDKIANLKTYYDLARKEFRSAEVRVIVVTNTRDLARLKGSCGALDQGPPANDYRDWWRPLPLGTVDDQVNKALSDHAPDAAVARLCFLVTLIVDLKVVAWLLIACPHNSHQRRLGAQKHIANTMFNWLCSQWLFFEPSKPLL